MTLFTLVDSILRVIVPMGPFRLRINGGDANMVDHGVVEARMPPRRAKPIAVLGAIGRFYFRLVRGLVAILFGTALLVASVLFVNYVVLSTAKDKAYRDLDPHSDVCQAGLAKGWTILADTGRRHLKDDQALDDDGWADPSDNEADVVAADAHWGTTLRCALQRHVVPASSPAAKPLNYHLGFLEFSETGEPYPLVFSEAGVEKPITSAMLQHGMENEMHARRVSAAAVRPVITQLDALKEHLASGSHYVVVFIHGWRHDARIGDQNIADLRLYAAHAARFLAQRCPSDPTVCDMDVTAVFVGWRGARVDELGLKGLFGDAIGGFLGNLSAGATLFDRKPVSEQVAPGAISALRTLEGVMAPDPASPRRHNKMIVFGHSLGGNMLATGLRDDLVKAVDRHVPGSVMPPVLGNLVVLLNPAAEASKWTDIQREVWHRTVQTVGTQPATQPHEDDLFPRDQKPVVVSVTAALAFPAGGLRRGDCEWIGLTIDDGYAAARRRIRQRLAGTDSMFDAGVDYDWATHDLFPTFKFDFRPASAFLDHVAARIEHRQPLGQSCAHFPAPGLLAELQTLPLRTIALLASTFPFQTSAQEQSHTIGNLDPPRPAAGLLSDRLPSAAPFGTTHELLGLHEQGKEAHHPYATLADAPIDCPATNTWLSRARQARMDTGGLYWDSEVLAPAAQGLEGGGKPAAHFLHGFELSGTAPITQANDPFWNMRAFDNALSRHDGYRLTSFICAMNQLVLDDITGTASVMSNHMGEAPAPRP